MKKNDDLISESKLYSILDNNSKKMEEKLDLVKKMMEIEKEKRS
jgi:hypothetical protein